MLRHCTVLHCIVYPTFCLGRNSIPWYKPIVQWKNLKDINSNLVCQFVSRSPPDVTHEPILRSSAMRLLYSLVSACYHTRYTKRDNPTLEYSCARDENEQELFAYSRTIFSSWLCYCSRLNIENTSFLTIVGLYYTNTKRSKCEQIVERNSIFLLLWIISST